MRYAFKRPRITTANKPPRGHWRASKAGHKTPVRAEPRTTALKIKLKPGTKGATPRPSAYPPPSLRLISPSRPSTFLRQFASPCGKIRSCQPPPTETPPQPQPPPATTNRNPTNKHILKQRNSVYCHHEKMAVHRVGLTRYYKNLLTHWFCARNF